MDINCLECSYDLTLLFYPEDKMGKMVVKCPDCDTKFRLKEEGSREIEVVPNKTRKPFPVGPVFDNFVPITVEQRTQLENERLNAYRTKCLTCKSVVSLFQSYLVRIQTTIFPKKEETITSIAPDGTEVEGIKTTHLPPVKQKGRICRDCFNNIPTEEFTKGNFELLPDQENMQRDGLRNVKASAYTPKYEEPIERYTPEEEFPLNSIPDDTPDWFNRVFGKDGVLESKITFSALTPTESLTKKVVKKSFPLRPSRINVNLHPSRRVRRISIPKFSEVEFTPKNRRDNFKRWFEHG